MSISRRKFLKIAGITTIAGLGGTSILGGIWRENLNAAQITTDPRALTAKRWGIGIDMSKFRSGDDIKRVTNACHRIHNVPEFSNPKEDIKWIWTEKFGDVFPEQKVEFINEKKAEMPFLVLCNHCANPPCVRICPTKATFKRKDGIVMQDMHRCIGCRICMAACPYGARSFNYRDPRPFIKEENKEYPTRMIGVVEKCTLCYERLAKGLMPACVEESNGAIVFGDLEDPTSNVRKMISAGTAIVRKPKLGTHPSVFYVIGGNDYAVVPELL